MNTEEVCRKSERYIAGKLSAIVGGSMPFLSLIGGGESDDAVEVEPPFVVVGVNNARNDTYLNVFFLQGAVQVVTHMSEYTPSAHSALANSVEEAIRQMEAEVIPGFHFNGIDISATRFVENSDEKVRVTAIDFTAGVCG